jgi:3-hydroxyisobutyrate dehydrogenase-like beta-hydroxyacid dehydrogenase
MRTAFEALSFENLNIIQGSNRIVAKLGFLGLGIMGNPMALHLADAGHTLAVWSHNPQKARELAKSAGAVFCECPEAVAEQSDCVFLCVGDTAMSREVILGERGLVQGAKPGFIVVDCSTVSPLESARIASELSSRQIHFLDAPCTGSKAGAERGELTFMIGGPAEVFERVRPYFGAMGKALYYCGKSGMGLRAKLTQNLILGNLLQAFNEGLVLSTKAGVDPELMLDILNNSAARSGLIAAKAPAVFKRDFSTNFSVKWLSKDIRLAIDLGSEIGVPLPLTALAQQLFQSAVAKGYGEEDICGSIRVLEELAGCEVRTARQA